MSKLRAGPFDIVEVPALIPATYNELPAADLVFDLPLPPSVNRTSGTRLGNEHPKVREWRRCADAHLIYTGQSRHIRAIEGPVVIEICWDTQTLGDIDNRIKHLLDYLQRLQIVSNDSHCRSLRVGFGTAPDGCRVRVRSWCGQ